MQHRPPRLATSIQPTLSTVRVTYQQRRQQHRLFSRTGEPESTSRNQEEPCRIRFERPFPTREAQQQRVAGSRHVRLLFNQRASAEVALNVVAVTGRFEKVVPIDALLRERSKQPTAPLLRSNLSRGATTETQHAAVVAAAASNLPARRAAIFPNDLLSPTPKGNSRRICCGTRRRSRFWCTATRNLCRPKCYVRHPHP